MNPASKQTKSWHTYVLIGTGVLIFIVFLVVLLKQPHSSQQSPVSVVSSAKQQASSPPETTTQLTRYSNQFLVIQYPADWAMKELSNNTTSATTVMGPHLLENTGVPGLIVSTTTASSAAEVENNENIFVNQFHFHAATKNINGHDFDFFTGTVPDSIIKGKVTGITHWETIAEYYESAKNRSFMMTFIYTGSKADKSYDALFQSILQTFTPLQ